MRVVLTNEKREIFGMNDKCDSLIFEINQVKGSNISALAWFNNHFVDLDNGSVIVKAGNFRERKRYKNHAWHFALNTNKADNNSWPLIKKYFLLK